MPTKIQTVNGIILKTKTNNNFNMRFVRKKLIFFLGIVCLLSVFIFMSGKFNQMAGPDYLQVIDPSLLKR